MPVALVVRPLAVSVGERDTARDAGERRHRRSVTGTDGNAALSAKTGPRHKRAYTSNYLQLKYRSGSWHIYRAFCIQGNDTAMTLWTL